MKSTTKFVADGARYRRQGFPEAIYTPGKTNEQLVKIAKKLCLGVGPVMATRADEKHFRFVKKYFKNAKYFKTARIILFNNSEKPKNTTAYICVVSAGTSDIAVAEEAAVTAELLGAKVERIYDVGVSGIHRVLERSKEIKNARVVVVCAGMEGALASVVGGLATSPVIGVPTSIGYGVSFGGISALLTMLNSCAANVSVVNIDDGFGAGIIAALICK
ncbi:MAG: nickel pincer cofactor biosynthesis protein LarB [Endomicrobiales bacterium]|nr:nickel pincer cofactor biosynthesis protein LarB [Endomicrobiales bacterium]